MSGVLAVIDAVVDELRHGGDTGHVENLLDARAAMAELIVACEAEQLTINDYLLSLSKESWDAYRPAMLRRRAALARAKGESA